MDALYMEGSHGLAATTGYKKDWEAKREKQNDKGRVVLGTLCINSAI